MAIKVKDEVLIIEIDSCSPADYLCSLMDSVLDLVSNIDFNCLEQNTMFSILHFLRMIKPDPYVLESGLVEGEVNRVESEVRCLEHKRKYKIID